MQLMISVLKIDMYNDVSNCINDIKPGVISDIKISNERYKKFQRERLRLRLRQVYSAQNDIIQMRDIRHTWQFLCIIQY